MTISGEPRQWTKAGSNSSQLTALHDLVTRGFLCGSPQDTIPPRLISLHGLEGIAVEAVEAGALQLPDSSVAYLKDVWKRRLRRRTLIDLEAGRIGAALREQRGAQVLANPVLLKGESVASRYENPLLRNYSDIDLLVPPEEAPVWGVLLRRLGYLPESRWRERHQGMYDNHVAYSRGVPGSRITCEVHTRLCALGPLIRFGYRPLAAFGRAASPAGLKRLDEPAQVVALAVHLLHHSRNDRRLIWYRDFFELGSPQTIQTARELARDWEVDWVLEWALGQVQDVAGAPIWGAREVRVADSGLLRALERDNMGLPLHLGLAREMRPLAGLGYLASKFDPRRFCDEKGKFQWQEFEAWLIRMGRLILLRSSSRG